MSEEQKPAALSPESLAAIEREAAKYPPAQRASTIMAALRIAQKEKGWLANETIEAVAEVVGVASVRALEVATFYNMYHLRPVGRRTPSHLRLPAVRARRRGRDGGQTARIARSRIRGKRARTECSLFSPPSASALATRRRRCWSTTNTAARHCRRRKSTIFSPNCARKKKAAKSRFGDFSP